MLEVDDNGKGITPGTHAGVGLTSMRERATELGGEFLMERNPAGGTRVRAWLPLGKD
jgi:signal transduction histidine kinase